MDICWVDEFVGSKPNFSVKFYAKETGTIVDAREISASDYGQATKWAAENCPGNQETGCLIVAM